MNTQERRKQHETDVMGLFGPKKTWTTRELSKALGLGETYVEAAAKRLVQQGVLEDTKSDRQRHSRWTLVAR